VGRDARVVGATMDVEVWLDFACPWCYLTRRRVHRAVAEFAHGSALRVVSRTWQNDPDAPPDYGMTTIDLVVERYGMSRDQALAANADCTAQAAEEGLAYRVNEARGGNTVPASRLFHFAKTRGLADAFEERVLEAYICEEATIGLAETLVHLGCEVGLPREELETVLAGNAFADEVRADRERGLAFGIAGVPFIVVDGRHVLAGANRVEALVDTLERAWNTRVGATAS
jgi:predicted DsbA family dithiol-disulfide isomerase